MDGRIVPDTSSLEVQAEPTARETLLVLVFKETKVADLTLIFQSGDHLERRSLYRNSPVSKRWTEAETSNKNFGPFHSCRLNILCRTILPIFATVWIGFYLYCGTLSWKKSAPDSK